MQQQRAVVSHIALPFVTLPRDYEHQKVGEAVTGWCELTTTAD